MIKFSLSFVPLFAPNPGDAIAGSDILNTDNKNNNDIE